MNILITGTTGFVGSKLIFHLEKEGHKVFGIDKEGVQKQTFDIHPNNKTFDLNDDFEKYPFKDEKIDCVLHCAAEKSDFAVSESGYKLNNVDATEGAVELAKYHQVKYMIYISTVSAYGHKNEPADETAEFIPDNPYGQTKYDGELICEEWVKSHTDHKLTILRPSVIYGIKNYANMYNLMYFLLKRSYVMVGKGDNIKSMVALDNFIDMITLFCNKVPEAKVSAFNCIDKPYMNVREIMEVVSEVEGYKKPFLNIPLWLAFLLTSPFELLSRLLRKDLKVNWNRLYKLSASTDYRAEKIRNYGYTQRFSSKEKLQEMAIWLKKTLK